MQTSALLAILPAFLAVASARPEPFAMPMPMPWAMPVRGGHSDPTQNPKASNPQAPVGSQANPAAVHYDPTKQPEQNKAINDNPALQRPMQTAKAAGEDPTKNRQQTYGAHGPAAPGMTKEDQPPASAAHYGKPGDLTNAPGGEQKEQAAAMRKATAIANQPGGGGYIQQIPDPNVGGGASNIPKKQKRALEARGVLYARAAAAKAYNDVLDNLDVLFSRSVNLDESEIMDILYARTAEPEPEVQFMYTREAAPQYSSEVYVREAEPEYQYLYSREAEPEYQYVYSRSAEPSFYYEDAQLFY